MRVQDPEQAVVGFKKPVDERSHRHELRREFARGAVGSELHDTGGYEW